MLRHGSSPSPEELMELYATLLRDNLGKKENQTIVMSTAMWHRHCCGEGDTHTGRDRDRRERKRRNDRSWWSGPTTSIQHIHRHTQRYKLHIAHINKSQQSNHAGYDQHRDETTGCRHHSSMYPNLDDAPNPFGSKRWNEGWWVYKKQRLS